MWSCRHDSCRSQRQKVRSWRRSRWRRRPRSSEKHASPRVTALRRAGPDRVEIEVDGGRWRVVPDEVVVRAALEVGLLLDRVKLRGLVRELRRAEALSVAVRALARSDLSRSRLEDRLERGRVRPTAARQALETLERLGVVDDGRAAETRARALARLGWGDAAIAAKLEAEGFASEAVTAALGSVVPESERAARVVATEPDLRRAYGLLARRGFMEETIEEALGRWTADLPKE